MSISDRRLAGFSMSSPGWDRQLRLYTQLRFPAYWDGFVPTTEAAIRLSESELNRKLPTDYKQFLLRIGPGRFPQGVLGGFDPPEDLVANSPRPIWTTVDRAAARASDREYEKFYISRGSYDPFDGQVTDSMLRHDGVSLFDLLQIGSDGSCCYHQLWVGEGTPPFGYCLLTPEGTFENIQASFSDALRSIVLGHMDEMESA